MKSLIPVTTVIPVRHWACVSIEILKSCIFLSNVASLLCMVFHKASDPSPFLGGVGGECMCVWARERCWFSHRPSWIFSLPHILVFRGWGCKGVCMTLWLTHTSIHTHTHMLWLCHSKFLSLFVCMVGISWFDGEAVNVFLCTLRVMSACVCSCVRVWWACV